MSDEIILKLENIRRSYRMGRITLDVLKGVDLELHRGEWCCIYGASGSGKTTLLNIIGTLERPDAGKIVINGIDVLNMSKKEMADFRSGYIGFVFQSYHLLPELTVWENVALTGMLSGKKRAVVMERAADLLSQVGLSDRLRHRPAELSGGEQQRAAIARALMNEPPLLLADEPTGNLDPQTGEGILELFRELQAADPGRTILMITHNRDIAVNASKVVDLKDGVLV